MTSMPGGRAVGGRGRRGVAGRGADDGPGAGLGGLGHGDDHAAVLERAGRVLALDLEVQVRRSPSASPSRVGVDQRREALAEGQARRRVGHRQERAVALHESRSGGGARHGRSVIDGIEGDVHAVGQDRRERSPDLRQRHGLRSGWPCRPRRRPTPPRRGRRQRLEPRSTAGRNAYQCARRRAVRRPRRRPVTAGSPARSTTPRATARRSPRTALLVAAPPAPGPASRTVPRGSASISTRFSTPSSSRTGCRRARPWAGRHPMRCRRRGPRRSRAASGSARGRGALHLPSVTPVIPGWPVPCTVGGRRRDRAGSSHAPNAEAGQDDELVDRVVALDVAASDPPRRSPAPGRR